MRTLVLASIILAPTVLTCAARAEPPVAGATGAPPALTAPAAPPAPAAQATASPTSRAGDPTPAIDATTMPADRTFTIDAVFLQSGKVVQGDRALAVPFEGNVYWFSSTASRDQFARDPEHYAAMDGGACGRMGPLGGLGDARLYAVQDGRLYFFDSEACREEFRKTPMKFMETYDDMPTGTPEEQAAGLAAVDRWVAWVGGKDAVKAAGSMTQTSSQEVTRGGKQWNLTETISFEGPRTMRRLTRWERPGGMPSDAIATEVVLDGKDATLRSDRALPVVLSKTRRMAFERMLNRHPYAILRARFRPEAGFLAIKTGEGRLGDADCDYVVTWFDGNRTYLAIDKATGRLVQEGYVGRDTMSRNGSLTLDAVAYAGTDALRLPTQWVVSHTGEKEGDKGPLATITVGPAPTKPPVPSPAPAPSVQPPVPPAR